MTTAYGQLNASLAEASGRLRAAAVQQGYALSGWAGEDTALILTKGMTAFSWGSKITVSLAPAGETQTNVRFETAETFAITDWGRGRRAIGRILRAAGGQTDLSAH
jgi:hypothetical protein